MTQPFKLWLIGSSSPATIDFLGTDYKAVDGSFNISSPDKDPRLVIYRPGPFYIPTKSELKPRTLTLKFDVYGTDRSDIIDKLNAIRRKIIAAESRWRWRPTVYTSRVQFVYAWQGANYATYFEVYGGKVIAPEDALSVEKMHYKVGSEMVVPDCELELLVSPVGYGANLVTAQVTEIPLYNPNVGSKTTGGVNVRNPITRTSDPHYNWVEIDGNDIPGSEPCITKIVCTSDPTDWYGWDKMYIGLCLANWPSRILFEDHDIVNCLSSKTEYGDSNSSGDPATYSVISNNFSEPGVRYFADCSWEIDYNSIGIHYVFLHSKNSLPTYMHYAVGYDDYTKWYIRWVGDFTRPRTSSDCILPLGPLQWPPGSPELMDLGVSGTDPSLNLGLFIAYEQTSVSYTIDCLSFLPITDGLRILVNRGVNATNLAGDIVDDPLLGILYRKGGAPSYVSTPLYGLLEPLKLMPGFDQRLYFMAFGSGSQNNNYANKFKVKVYVLPTYEVMVE